MSQIIYHWINFIILFGFLGFVLKKQLTRYFKEQRRLLEVGMEEAKAQHDEIKKEYDLIKELSDNVESKMKDLENITAKEIELETKKIKSDSERFAEKIAKDGVLKVRAEAARANKAFQKELFAKALAEAKSALIKDSQKIHKSWTAQVVQSDHETAEKKNYAS